MGKDISKLIDSASDAIQKNLPKTMNGIDGFGGTLTDFINNVLLFKVKELNLKYQLGFKKFQQELEERYEKIPDDNRQLPPLEIAGPICEYIKYAINNDTLRNMYTDLLVASMDNRMSEKVHSSYVEIIIQLTSDEIKILHQLPRLFLSEPIVDILVVYPQREGLFTIQNNFGVLGKEAKCDYPNRLPVYLDNLKRLGLVEIRDIPLAEDWRYDKITQDEDYRKLIDNIEPNADIQLSYKTVGITNYADAMRSICTLHN